ncbi:MAG: response regulator [Pseudomonadota bacterium]|nr:response regulator [Pseudomonadota bacterium]
METLAGLSPALESSHSSFNRKLERERQRFDELPVLLVEDNEVNRIVAINMLEQLGCHITEANNGVEALHRLHENHYAIVFMDVHMPEMDGFEATQRIREREQASNQHTIIVAMTANAMSGDAQHCLTMGMDDYIAKPISLERIIKILDKYAQVPTKSAVQLTRQQENHHKILLVEDNPVNRIVELNMLKSLNCHVEIVENGKEALNACAQTDYDLILMDIQMPVMDGIEATRRIRQQHDQEQRTPIVAVTANNMPQDLERYFSAGIDDCISKPVTVERLRSVIGHYLQFEVAPTSSPQAFECSSQPSPELNQQVGITVENIDLPTFDVDQAKRIAIGNIRILRKIVDKFAQDTPKQLEKLQAAWQAEQLTDIERLAHSLKGSARSIGALRLGEIAFIIEKTAKEPTTLTEIAPLLPALKAEFIQLQELWEITDWNNLL